HHVGGRHGDGEERVEGEGPPATGAVETSSMDRGTPMMSRADALERWLVRLEAGDDLSELERQGTSRAPALARELAIADAIRREAARIDAPSFDRTWERFAVRLHHPAAARSSRRR